MKDPYSMGYKLGLDILQGKSDLKFNNENCPYQQGQNRADWIRGHWEAFGVGGEWLLECDLKS
jgi:ribosome modulation factor